MATQLDPVQQFAYKTMDRAYLAEALNEHIGRYHLDEKWFAWDDARLTDAVCQAAADSMGAVKPNEVTIEAEGDALIDWMHKFFNSTPVPLTKYDYLVGLVMSMTVEERAKLLRELKLLEANDHAAINPTGLKDQH